MPRRRLSFNVKRGDPWIDIRRPRPAPEGDPDDLVAFVVAVVVIAFIVWLFW